jgi:hypothetical protein
VGTWLGIAGLILGLISLFLAIYFYIYPLSDPTVSNGFRAMRDDIERLPKRIVDRLPSAGQPATELRGTKPTPQVPPVSGPIAQIPSVGDITSGPQASPAEQEAVERNKRLASLRNEAARWLDRKGPEYHDFSYVRKSITSGDIGRFSPDDRVAWDRLAAAEALLAWPDRGLNAATRTSVPIAVTAPQSYDASRYRDRPVADRLVDRLSREKFNIVDGLEAALFIEVTDVRTSAYTSGKPLPGSSATQWNGDASLKIRAVWIGGKKLLFAEPFSGIAAAASQSAAAEMALDRAVQNAASYLVTLSGQKQTGIRDQ